MIFCTDLNGIGIFVAVAQGAYNPDVGVMEGHAHDCDVINCKNIYIHILNDY